MTPMISYKEWPKTPNDHILSNYQISPRLFFKEKPKIPNYPMTLKNSYKEWPKTLSDQLLSSCLNDPNYHMTLGNDQKTSGQHFPLKLN